MEDRTKVDKKKETSCSDKEDLIPKAVGKGTDGSLMEALKKSDEMKGGDIFLKHSEEPDSTHIAVRKDNIVLATADGLSGVKISSGEVSVQGELVIKNMGAQITKGWFTENSLSFLPSTIYSQIPGYLFKLPIGKLLNNGVTDLLRSFIGDFYKG